MKVEKILIEDIIFEDIEAMKKYYPNIPSDDFMYYIELDPTYREGSNNAGTYGKWILGLANKGEIDNIGHITDVLSRFESEKNNLVNRDIMKYKSVNDVEDMLNDENSYKDLSHRQEVRQRQKERKNVDLDKDAKKVYEDKDWEIWIPLTYAASCKLGQGTTWCTASTEDDYYYNYYSKEGPLYIIINKKDPEKKYQFHIESRQFMNAEDEEESLLKFFVDNMGLFKYFNSVMPDSAIEDFQLPSYNHLEELKENNYTFTYNSAVFDEGLVPFIKHLIIDREIVPDSCFENARNLRTVHFSDKVKSIGVHAFAGCIRLSKVELPDSIEQIGAFAFDFCTSLKTFILNNTISYISKGLFEYCSALTYIKIPANILSIDVYAFYNAGLKEVEFASDSQLISIKEGAFAHSKIQTIELPNNLQHLYTEVFAFCRLLETVVIGNNLKNIANRTFLGCYALEKIYIPNSVERISIDAFKECKNLYVYTNNKYVQTFCEAFDIPWESWHNETEELSTHEAFDILNDI